MKIKKYIQINTQRVNEILDLLLVPETHFPQTISQAVRYSTFAGGKRIRPLLALAAAECLGIDHERVIRYCAAIELVHTYTLIHDDLPCIDNDDYRRGKKTCHKVYGEAMAVLAGDVLQTIAFEVFSKHVEGEEIKPQHQLKAAYEFARTIGIDGTVGGQVVDIESEGREVDVPTLEYIHIHKTGELILFSIKLPALLMGIDDERMKALETFGKNIGLAFQVVDDILDVTGSEEQLGKTPGKDLASQKLTYPAIYGLEESKEIAANLYGTAIDALDIFGEKASNLKEIARIIVERDN